MKILVLLLALLFVLPTFANKCIATEGKYWDEDKTASFKEHAKGKDYYNTYSYSNGWNYNFSPKLYLPSENQLFTFKIKRVNKTEGFMWYYNSFMQFEPNLYWYIDVNQVTVMFNNEMGQFKGFSADLDDKIDHKFVQFSLFINESGAELYIDGKLASTFKQTLTQFKQYYYDKPIWMTYLDDGQAINADVKDILLAQDVDEIQKSCLLDGKRLHQSYEYQLQQDQFLSQKDQIRSLFDQFLALFE